MAFQDVTIPTEAPANSLFNREKKVSSELETTITIGTDAGAPSLVTLTPMGLNKVTGKWGRWIAPVPTELEVSLVSASSGTFTITVNGMTTATIAYDATSADVEAALAAIGVQASDVLDTSVHTISFDALENQTVLPIVTGDVSSISGGTPAATTTAGTATNGLHEIRGFLFPDDYALSATEETIAPVSIKGTYGYSDIEGSMTLTADEITALKVALKDGLLAKGMTIQGLPGIA